MAKTHTITRKGLRYHVRVEEDGQFKYRYSSRDFCELLELIGIHALGLQKPEACSIAAENIYELRNNQGALITSGSPRDITGTLERISQKPADITIAYQEPKTKLGRTIATIANEF